MNRLEQAEARFDDLLRDAESKLARAAKSRAEAARSLELIDHIEERTEVAIRQLRDIIRQGEGGLHG